MPPKGTRALEWTKGFNNASPTERIAFLKRVEELDENERPKLNSVAAKTLFEYMINVSAYNTCFCGSESESALHQLMCANRYRRHGRRPSRT
jgi:hypothetical protein